jgi:hypothetical protein
MLDVDSRAVFDSAPAPTHSQQTEALFKEAKRRERRRRLIKVGGAAVILLGAAAIAVHYATGQPKAVSKGATSSLNRTENGGAPTGTRSLFYLQPLNRQNTLNAYEWNGKKVRTVHTAVPVGEGGFSQSPDGMRIVADSTLLDRNGHILRKHSHFLYGTWSSDGRDICSTGPAKGSQDPFSGPEDLYLFNQNGLVHRIARIGSQFVHTNYDVVSCMPSLHRALVSESFMGMIDGEILIDYTNPLDPSVVRKSLEYGSSPCSKPYLISGDGAYAASIEEDGNSGIICSQATHKAVAHFPGQAEALNRNFVITTISEPPNDITPEVIDWHTGKILWRGTKGNLYPSIWAEFEPGGSGVAFTVLTEAIPLQPDKAQGWLVRPGKRPKLLSSAATPTIS